MITVVEQARVPTGFLFAKCTVAVKVIKRSRIWIGCLSTSGLKNNKK